MNSTIKALGVSLFALSLAACGGGGGGGGKGPVVEAPITFDGVTMATTSVGGVFSPVSTGYGETKVSIDDSAGTIRLQNNYRGVDETYHISHASGGFGHDFRFVELNNGSGTSVVADLGGDLEYSSYGIWTKDNGSHKDFVAGAFAVGEDTPVASMPTSGTATYKGAAYGLVSNASTGEIGDVTGAASITVDFVSGSVVGSLSDMKSQNFDPSSSGKPQFADWANVSFVGNLQSGTNQYVGSTVGNAHGGVVGDFELGPSSSGSFAGEFYGPGAAETGGVWNLSDGNVTAVGGFGGAK